MKNIKKFHLLFIIISILIFSLAIGDAVMAPIIIYYKLLVEFFGWLFLFLVTFLMVFKLYANFIRIQSASTADISTLVILKKTFFESFSQVFRKGGAFLVFLLFLILVGSLTVLAIWINSKVLDIRVH